MGVYHLMGLGRSVGVVTGPVSYLAHRYTRWNPEDREFFGRSGEASQRERGAKVGDIQAIVLFTSPEVIKGYDPELKKDCLAYDYIENLPGTTKGPECKGGKMRELLPKVLCEELQGICGGRKECELFWCQVDRRDITITYERVATVVAAVAGTGALGHEIWVNLTGGNNVINLSLELAASLSGKVGRIYYVQAQDAQAEKCIRYTAENGYWVEIPVIPLSIPSPHRAILSLLSEVGEMGLEEMLSRLKTHADYWAQFESETPDSLRSKYLDSLWKEGLVEGSGRRWRVSRRWELIRHFQDLWESVAKTTRSLENLAKDVKWLERDILRLK
jgi:hypothetical protein